MLIHGIQTQGARTTMGLSETFTMFYTLSYSMDNEHWNIYRGNSSDPSRVSISHVFGLRMGFYSLHFIVNLYIIVLHLHDEVGCHYYFFG